MKTQMTTAIVFTELASITNYLNAAREVMIAGHMPDITPLTTRVAAMCEMITVLPKSEQQVCLAKLAHLVEELDDCEKQIKTWKEKNSP